MNVKELNAKLQHKKDSLPKINKKRNTSKTMITSKPDTPKKNEDIMITPKKGGTSVSDDNEEMTHRSF